MRFLLALLVLAITGCGSPQSTLSSSSLTKHKHPNASTPGKLCSGSDTYFDGYRYKEQIAHCARHVTKTMKLDISKNYGIDEADWGKYEFDHWYPLAIGGSTDIENIFPEPIDEATIKDKLEDQLYHQMDRGEITQEGAIRQIDEW